MASRGGRICIHFLGTYVVLVCLPMQEEQGADIAAQRLSSLYIIDITLTCISSLGANFIRDPILRSSTVARFCHLRISLRSGHLSPARLAPAKTRFEEHSGRMPGAEQFLKRIPSFVYVYSHVYVPNPFMNRLIYHIHSPSTHSPYPLFNPNPFLTLSSPLTNPNGIASPIPKNTNNAHFHLNGLIATQNTNQYVNSE